AAVVKVALNPPAGPTLALQTLTMIVDEAYARGLMVTGHVHDLAELDIPDEPATPAGGHMGFVPLSDVGIGGRAADGPRGAE
ncbi:MAG: hypothetical protein KY453_12510, partial [Gemmatimonadetes bacterium]|nr:hypothetical protein [Gemmatimonadota bacterium]